MGWTGVHDRRLWVADYKKGWTMSMEYDYKAQDFVPLAEPKIVTIRKHHAHRNEDWFIVDVSEGGRIVETVITLILWDAGWVKDMDESQHPYYYGCPVEWFGEVPVASQAWRDACRAAQNKQVA